MFGTRLCHLFRAVSLSWWYKRVEGTGDTIVTTNYSKDMREIRLVSNSLGDKTGTQKERLLGDRFWFNIRRKLLEAAVLCSLEWATWDLCVPGWTQDGCPLDNGMLCWGFKH